MMRPNQRKNFYAQRFQTRLGPFTNGSAHVRVPKDPKEIKSTAVVPPNAWHTEPAYTSAYKPSARTVRPPPKQPAPPRITKPAPVNTLPVNPMQWEEEPLSAASFRARALEQALRQSELEGWREPVRPATPYVQAPAARQLATPVVNAELSSLDVLVGNSQLTVQPKPNVFPRAAYLLNENEKADLYQRDTVAFGANSGTINCVELVLEITGPLGSLETYCGASNAVASFYVGAHGVFAPCKTLSDYLMHGRLESIESEPPMHLFRLPLGFAPGQGVLLRDRAKLRVVFDGDLSELREMGFRHRFFVRYFEEK